MDLKSLADKLANIDKLEKVAGQLDKKVPGEQPTMDPKADIQAMKQALNAIRSPITPTAQTSTTTQPAPTTAPNVTPPEEREMQQKNKPGEPIGEEQLEEETARERYIRQAKERVANDPSFIYQVDKRVRDEVMSSMTPQQRNIARIQRNLANAYASNDQEAIEKYTAELEKRKKANEKPETKPESKPETKPESKPETKPESKPETKPESKPKANDWYRGKEGDYVIQSGDTLSGISKKTGIPMSQLMKMNDIKNPNRIIAGAKLKTGKTTVASQPETKPNNNDFVFDPISKELVPGDSEIANAVRSGERAAEPTDVKTSSTANTNTVNDVAGFKFTPEQEKWLGNANRQDPDIIARMPGPKPPISYFKTPELRDAARLINQGNQNLNSVANTVWRSKDEQNNSPMFQDDTPSQSGASTKKPTLAGAVGDAQSSSTATPPPPPKPDIGQGAKDAQAASTAKPPEVKSLDTLRQTAGASNDPGAAKTARDEIKHRMQAGTLKENLITLNNVVEELLNRN